LTFQLVLEFTSVREGKKVAGPHQSPRTLSACPTRDAGIVISKPPGNVVGDTDIALPDAVLKHVDTIVHVAALRDGCGGRIRTYDLQVMSYTVYSVVDAGD
jgi:hypothetical protein